MPALNLLWVKCRYMKEPLLWHLYHVALNFIRHKPQGRASVLRCLEVSADTHVYSLLINQTHLFQCFLFLIFSNVIFLWKHNKCMWHPHNPLYYCLKTTTFPSETGPSSESFPRCSLGFLNYWKVIVVNMLSLFSYKLSLGLEIVQCQDKERIGSGHHHSLHDLIKSRRVQSEVKPSLTSLDFVFLKRNDPNHLHCIWEKLIFQQHIVENRNHM